MSDPIRLSPSQISAWCACHYDWSLQYVQKRKRPAMGTIPKFGIILHNLLEDAVRCQILGEEYRPGRVEDYLDSILTTAEAAGEEMTEREARGQLEHVLSHVEVFRAAYLPKLQPVAVEESWEWALEDEAGACVVFVRGDLRDARGFWVDHKLKNKVPSDVSTVPAVDLLELQIQAAACPETKDVVAQIYAKGGRKQAVIPLNLTGGRTPRYPDAQALRDETARIVCGVAAGMRAGDDAPTGLWTERWGRQTCYYCDWRKIGACKYAGGR